MICQHHHINTLNHSAGKTQETTQISTGSSSRDLVKGPIFVTFSGLKTWPPFGESFQVTLKKLEHVSFICFLISVCSQIHDSCITLVEHQWDMCSTNIQHFPHVLCSCSFKVPHTNWSIQRICTTFLFFQLNKDPRSNSSRVVFQPMPKTRDRMSCYRSTSIKNLQNSPCYNIGIILDSTYSIYSICAIYTT